MNFLKAIYKRIFPGSTLSHKFFWKFRFLFAGKSLDEREIINDLNHPHRKELLLEFSRFSEVDNVLELGSSWGPNLFLLQKSNQGIHYLGIDISKQMANAGNEYFRSNNINNIKISCGDMTSLSSFRDNEFDIIISDAALIYVDNKNIIPYVNEIVRIAKLGLIIIEFDDESNDPFGKTFEATWIRDYRAVFQKYALKIDKRCFDEKIWPGKWSEFGKIITVFLS
jgi:ubiquinone/menaquinone biosynthesis C-methylase UbiE